MCDQKLFDAVTFWEISQKPPQQDPGIEIHVTLESLKNTIDETQAMPVKLSTLYRRFDMRMHPYVLFGVKKERNYYVYEAGGLHRL